MRPPSLRKALEWRGTPGCSCEHAYKELGRLHGVSLGPQWVRVSDNPDCPHHGKQAAAKR